MRSLRVRSRHSRPALTLARDMDQLFGAGQGIGQRLLDERVQITLQHRHADVDMCRRRDDDRDCLDVIEQRLERGERGGLELCGHLSGAYGVVVVKSPEIRSVHLAEEPYVVETQ